MMNPETREQELIEFENVKAIRDWVKSHGRGSLAMVRPDGLHRVLNTSTYARLDPAALYTVKAAFDQQGVLATKHHQIFDKAWENLCRVRMIEWFDQQGIYVVEHDRVLYDPEKGDSPAVEWEGMWRGVDESLYVLDCKYSVTSVYIPLLRRL
jgi:hypothetical protein